MSLLGSIVLAPALSPPATPPIENYAQVWSYCIISLFLLYHPPVLHDHFLVRLVHQILLTRPTLLKNDPFPLSFGLKYSPYYHPLRTKSNPCSTSILASCHISDL